MKVLVLYDKYSTFTNTVFDHLEALRRYSRHGHAFCHGEGPAPQLRWREFDAVVIHYSLRVAYGAISARLMDEISSFQGLKVLFVQDEYDYTERTREFIGSMRMGLVFSCVPAISREAVYPTNRYPGVRFVETLTGFAPEPVADGSARMPIAQRPIVVGYRGRALPYWYGDLGQEKQLIAEVVKQACLDRNITCDIEWDDARRIYGERWLAFLSSCKSTLGTESGANLFDYDGSLRRGFSAYVAQHPSATYAEAREAVVGEAPEEPIMNQVSPRIFEAIASGTALVLFEGRYSDVVRPQEHYLVLRKDFSNLDDVLGMLRNDALLQDMADRAYRDVIETGRYTFSSFVRSYDEMLELAFAEETPSRPEPITYGRHVTRAPTRMRAPQLPHWLAVAWQKIPPPVRHRIKPAARIAWDLVCRC